jgi:23S rRNA (adenine2030-N6)-methyltransferase
MNYRHAFHAGNFADVHKHVVLLALIERLKRKPTPMFFLDTHAGRGLYDLQSADSARSSEWREGIGRLHEATPQAADLRAYVEIAAKCSGKTVRQFRHYCGSPLLALAGLRAVDRAVFVEHETTEARALEKALPSQRGISVVCGDGYAALKTFLPPKENRGLVLIDPPYESADEFGTLSVALRTAVNRWPNGVYAAWYPLKANREATRFLATLQQSGIRKLLSLELSVRPPDSPLGLNGSGMIIINPPWQLDTELQPALQELHSALATDGAGGIRVEWLVGEGGI